MGIERMKDCLAAWMAAQGLSAAELTGMLGYKSKTSVARLLRGESNLKTMGSLLEQLFPRLDGEWPERFRRALRVEQYGPERYRLFRVMHESNFETAPAEILPHRGWPENDTVLLYGFPGKSLFAGVDALLQSRNQVIHYIMRDDIFTHPELLNGLITHITAMNYQAVLVDHSQTVPWNLAVTGSGKIYINHQWLDTGDRSFLPHQLREGISLYQYEDLSRGHEYVDFVRSAYETEKGAAVTMLRPTLALQMIPPEILFSSFGDFVAPHHEPIGASTATLRIVLEKRYENFYHRNKPTLLLFSRKAMDKFISEGTMTDRFFALRPFSPEERSAIVRTLEAFSREDQVRIALLDRKAWKYSFEAYENRGVLAYPSETNYNTRMETYREFFLPGHEFYELFTDFIQVGLELQDTETLRQFLGTHFGDK